MRNYFPVQSSIVMLSHLQNAMGKQAKFDIKSRKYLLILAASQRVMIEWYSVYTV